MTTEDIIRAAVEAYDRGDSAAVAGFLAQDLHYTINANPEIGPYFADTRSTDQFFDAVASIRADWSIDSYKIADLIVSGDRGAAQIAVTITSRHTGRKVDSRLALFMKVRDGQLTEIHEYHDTANQASSRLE